MRIPCVARSRGGGRRDVFVNGANPMLEAGVKISTSPVGVGIDLSLRMLAWGCRRGNPGGSRPSLHPPLYSERGGCALILYNFESKVQSDPFVHRWTGDALSNQFTNVWGGVRQLG